MLANISEIIDFIILKNVEQIRGWEDRIDTINSKPIQIQIKETVRI